MKNTYTIVDNFDKLDLSFTTGQLATNAIDAIQYTFIAPSIWINPLTTTSNYNKLALGTYIETINEPYIGGSSLNPTPIFSYAGPFMFGWTNKFQYAPDFRRYVTGHRFYIDELSLNLMYPKDYLYPATKASEDFKDYIYKFLVLGKETPSKASGPIESKEWLFDFLTADEKLFKNGQLFGNSFYLPQIFNPGYGSENPGGTWVPNANLDSPGYTYEKWDEQIKSIKNDSTKMAKWETTLPNGETIRNKILFRMYGSLTFENWSRAIKYFPLYDMPDGSIGEFANPMIERFENDPIYRDLLKKMFMYRVGFDYDGLGYTVPPAPKHLYFVTDLEKGVDTDEYEEYKTDIPNLVKVQSSYNYYLKNAEEFNQGVTAEWQLPNLYTYYGLKSKGNVYYKELVRLGQPDVQVLVGDISVKKYYQIANKSNFDNSMLPSAEQGFAYPADHSDVPVPYRYKNIIVGDKKFLENANSLVAGKLFPMYNRITVPSRESKFMNILKKSKTHDTFITFLANYFSNKCAPENKVHMFALHNGVSKVSNTALQVLDLIDVMHKGMMPDSPYMKYLSLNEGVRFGINDPDMAAAAKLMTQLGAPEAVLDPAPVLNPGQEESVSDYIQSKKLITSATDWSWMKEGKKCYSEILAFEIAKFKILPGGKKLHLQSVFLPALEDKSDEYIDTQIFYGHEYAYEVFTHSLVIGNRYRYNNSADPSFDVLSGKFVEQPKQLEYQPMEQDKNPDQGVVYLPKTWGSQVDENGLPIWPEKLAVKQETYPIIVRAPFYNADCLIADNKVLGEKETKKTTKVLYFPPLPPDIAFYPYKDNPNKILISLNINYGERITPTIPIFQEDTFKIKEQHEYQKQFGMNWPYLKYKTDDARNTFKIWRTTKKPNGWNAFNHDGDLSKTLDFEKNTAYEDHLHPNVDYYYFARAHDAHNNISMPTEIFHVRIVKEGGFPPYLVVKTHKFDDRIYQYEIPFRKYLKIDLKDGVRKLVDSSKKIGEANYSFNKVDTGLKISPLKKYKLRITSNKTGKKLDINLDFTKKINENYLNKTVEEPATLAEVELADEIIKAEGKINNPDDGPNC